jgi:hypothetical protein
MHYVSPSVAGPSRGVPGVLLRSVFTKPGGFPGAGTKVGRMVCDRQERCSGRDGQRHDSDREQPRVPSARMGPGPKPKCAGHVDVIFATGLFLLSGREAGLIVGLRDQIVHLESPVVGTSGFVDEFAARVMQRRVQREQLHS